MTRCRSALCAFAVVLGLALGAGSARAETTLCTPLETLPTTITAQGVYCLTSDFDLALAAGTAIIVNANNVVIDLNGHKIGNLSAGTGTFANGIYGFQRQNVTIKNGTIRGFSVGVGLLDDPPFTTSQGHVIEDLRLDQNWEAGIWIYGRGMVVRRNQVVSSGGTTHAADANGYGIYMEGPGNRVLDNDVIRVSKSGTGGARGIYFGGASADGIAVNNRITDSEVGLQMAVASTKYRDNVANHVTTGYLGGTDAGNNH
jgi:hypothetical protein